MKYKKRQYKQKDIYKFIYIPNPKAGILSGTYPQTAEIKLP